MGLTDGDLKPISILARVKSTRLYTSQNLGADLLLPWSVSVFVTLVFEHINTSSQTRLELCGLETFFFPSSVLVYCKFLFNLIICPCCKIASWSMLLFICVVCVVLKWQISILYIPVIYPSRPCSVKALSSAHRLCSVTALFMHTVNEDVLDNWWQILLSL